jgi:hypothetical protein
VEVMTTKLSMRNMLSRRQYIPYQEYYKKIIIGLIKILKVLL